MGRSVPRAVAGSVMLSVLLLLNALVAIPALHEFWHAATTPVCGGGHAHHASHDDDATSGGEPDESPVNQGGCAQPDCVVLAFTQGKLEVASSVAPVTRPESVPFTQPGIPCDIPAAREAWSSSFGRGPPALA